MLAFGNIDARLGRFLTVFKSSTSRKTRALLGPYRFELFLTTRQKSIRITMPGGVDGDHEIATFGWPSLASIVFD